MHALTSRPHNTLPACCVRSHPPADVIESLEQQHNAFIEHNMQSYYVFDGCRHAMKCATNQDLLNKKLHAKKTLQLFYERGKDNSLDLTE